MASEKHNLSLAVLRLASVISLEKSTRKCLKENEKLLWECHKGQLEYIEKLEKLIVLLKEAGDQERTNIFKEHLNNARTQLDENEVHLGIVQELIHQLEGTNKKFHINVEQLQKGMVFAKIDEDAEALVSQDQLCTETIVQEFEECLKSTDRLRTRIADVQNRMNENSDLVMQTTSDLIQDALTGE